MKSKPAYSYNPYTFEFCGIATAWESPLEPNVFYLPANSTFKKPEIQEGFIAKWDGKKWINKKISLQISTEILTDIK